MAPGEEGASVRGSRHSFPWPANRHSHLAAGSASRRARLAAAQGIGAHLLLLPRIGAPFCLTGGGRTRACIVCTLFKSP